MELCKKKYVVNYFIENQTNGNKLKQENEYTL